MLWETDSTNIVSHLHSPLALVIEAWLAAPIVILRIGSAMLLVLHTMMVALFSRTEPERARPSVAKSILFFAILVVTLILPLCELILPRLMTSSLLVLATFCLISQCDHAPLSVQP